MWPTPSRGARMSADHEGFRRELAEKDVLFSCEGTAESVIISRLCGSGKLLVPEDHLVRDRDNRPFTTARRARDLQRDFMDVGYPDGLMIARIVDVNPGVLSFSKLYRDRAVVRDVVTRPEIESLVLVREGAYEDWYAHGKSAMLPSEWCVRKLGMRRVKERSFLEGYWGDANELVAAIREYTRLLGGHKGDQLNLADLLA